MKRFILFAGDCYYPGGGAADFIDDYESLDDAKQCQVGCDWLHILDIHTGEVHETHCGEWTIKPIRELLS